MSDEFNKMNSKLLPFRDLKEEEEEKKEEEEAEEEEKKKEK